MDTSEDEWIRLIRVWNNGFTKDVEERFAKSVEKRAFRPASPHTKAQGL